MKKQYRNVDVDLCNLHVRKAENNGEESRKIAGSAVVFGVRSINLTPWSSYREVYEVIEPGAISQELIDRSDIVLTYEHDPKDVLGASVNGKGTLRCVLGDKTLDIECDLGHSQAAVDALDRVNRGDVRSMSFAYTCDENDSENGVSYEKLQERNENGKEVWLRHVKKITGLYDVTICHRPCYTDTSVETRSANEAIEKKIDDILNTRSQDDDAKEAFEIEQAELRHQMFLLQRGIRR